MEGDFSKHTYFMKENKIVWIYEKILEAQVKIKNRKLSCLWVHWILGKWVCVYFSQRHLLKGLSLPHCIAYILASYVRDYLTYRCELSMSLYWCMCLFLIPVPCCFDSCSLVVEFDVRWCGTSYFILCSLAIQDPLWFRINFGSVVLALWKMSLIFC